jgi:hypothetical protein
MTSFTCPKLDAARDWCMKLDKPCVPVQPGCVLCGKVELAERKRRWQDRPRDQERTRSTT